MKQINFIDIFSGCGGLSEGFKKNGQYNMLAAVEWAKPQVDNLRNRLEKKWGYSDAEKRVIHFDIQRTNELFQGWNEDEEFGTHIGLDALINDTNVDLIIGGPPCQSYSLGGRIGDSEGMQCDYRNFLFESYLKIVRKYKPKLFVFENVVGMLSARPGGGELVTDLIRKEIEASGYSIVDDLRKYATLDLSEFGVPQRRKRVIIIGIRNDQYLIPQQKLREFYLETLSKFKESTQTVEMAIGDLPKLYPLEKVENKISHFQSDNRIVSNHFPRYHNSRDIEIFKMLTKDIASGENKYVSTSSLKELYTKMTGKTSNVHKYFVLRLDQPSNTIPAHLNKDGLRHIHPDSEQARSITVREAARLQTFDDDYEFISNNGANYTMIGNAVPPKFAEKLAEAIKKLLI